MATAWIDLEDPDAETLRATLPSNIHQVALDRILRTPRHDDEPRPRLETHDDYVFGVLVFPLVTSDSVVYQEVDVITTIETLFTIRKTPPGHTACEFEDARDAALRDGASPGLCLYTVMNEIAERFLDVVDHFDDSIDELEDHVTVWPAAQIRDEISSIRHSILHIRRTLAPTRDAARAVLDDRVEIEGHELFPRDVEIHFADAYDKLLRATEGLETSRDLIAGVRDYVQAKIANDQNEVTKKLTVIASCLLLPTFIVGLYGQNFRRIPELHWGFGYAWSWGLIVATTILQLAYFRRKKWI